MLPRRARVLFRSRIPAAQLRPGILHFGSSFHSQSRGLLGARPLRGFGNVRCLANSAEERRAEDDTASRAPGTEEATEKDDQGQSAHVGADGATGTDREGHDNDHDSAQEEGRQGWFQRWRGRTKGNSASQKKGGRLSKVRATGSLAWQGVLGLFGMAKDQTGPSWASEAQDYPWVEFWSSAIKDKAYRNIHTGEVTKEKPADFDKYGAAQEMDTETTALTIVERKKSRWEEYADMLSQSPIMQALREARDSIAESELGERTHRVKQRARDVKEDVAETWETSQNPLVYKAAYAYDSLFGETEHARAISQIRQLDANFDTGPEFVDEMRHRLIPDVVGAFLRGDRLVLSAYCTDECLERVNAVFRTREKEGITVEPTVLGISQVSVLGAKTPDKSAPLVLLSAMVQQIHCMRNKKGEVVEGKEDEIRATFYVFALQRVYEPEKGGLVWQVAELSYTGSMLYL